MMAQAHWLEGLTKAHVKDDDSDDDSDGIDYDDDDDDDDDDHEQIKGALARTSGADF